MTSIPAQQIWNNFVNAHSVNNDGVPLFSTDGDKVVTKQVGKTYIRDVLKRSSAMEALVEEECDKLVKDWQDGTKRYDGLIYLMYKLSPDIGGLPCVIG